MATLQMQTEISRTILNKLILEISTCQQRFLIVTVVLLPGIYRQSSAITVLCVNTIFHVGIDITFVLYRPNTTMQSWALTDCWKNLWRDMKLRHLGEEWVSRHHDPVPTFTRARPTYLLGGSCKDKRKVTEHPLNDDQPVLMSNLSSRDCKILFTRQRT